MHLWLWANKNLLGNKKLNIVLYKIFCQRDGIYINIYKEIYWKQPASYEYLRGHKHAGY